MRPRADAASKLFSVLFFSLLDSVFLHNRNVKFDTYKKTRENKTLTEMNIKSCVFLYRLPNVSNLLEST